MRHSDQEAALPKMQKAVPPTEPRRQRMVRGDEPVCDRLRRAVHRRGRIACATDLLPRDARVFVASARVTEDESLLRSTYEELTTR